MAFVYVSLESLLTPPPNQNKIKSNFVLVLMRVQVGYVDTKTSGKLGPNQYRKGPRDRLEGQEKRYTHHYNCCVPGCTNSFRNAPNLKFYRIREDVELRKRYQVLLRNKALKLESQSTRVCLVHFEEGEKLSRQHLPSIFPWSKEKVHKCEMKRIYLERVRWQEATDRKGVHHQVIMKHRIVKSTVALMRSAANALQSTPFNTRIVKP